MNYLFLVFSSLLRKDEKKNKMSDHEIPPAWERFWQVVAVIFIILTLVAVIIACIFVATQDSVFRSMIKATPDNVVGAAGEAGGWAQGIVTLDLNSNNIKYDIRTLGTMSQVTAIRLRGPLVVGTRLGPIRAAICGAPYSSPCDVTTNPGIITGTVTSVYNGIDPPSADVKPLILDLRKEPHLYYYEILTANKPVSPGAVRDEFRGDGGFA
jgi:hypothetical protein